VVDPQRPLHPPTQRYLERGRKAALLVVATELSKNVVFENFGTDLSKNNWLAQGKLFPG